MILSRYIIYKYNQLKENTEIRTQPNSIRNQLATDKILGLLYLSNKSTSKKMFVVFIYIDRVFQQITIYVCFKIIMKGKKGDIEYLFCRHSSLYLSIYK